MRQSQRRRENAEDENFRSHDYYSSNTGMRAACFSLLLLLLPPPPLRAHDLEIRPTFAAPAVIVRAAYAGAEAVPFAKVQVFSPADAQHEFQAGNTDKLGKFSFVPDGGGAWRVVIDDEIGHRQEATVEVPASFGNSTPQPASGGPSRVERVITGVAILFGLTGIWYGRSKRNSARSL